jgi:hypothetical protein
MASAFTMTSLLLLGSLLKKAGSCCDCRLGFAYVSVVAGVFSIPFFSAADAVDPAVAVLSAVVNKRVPAVTAVPAAA